MADALDRGWILLVGPDGSGKSSVVDELTRQFGEQGVRVHHAHSRPHVIGGRARRDSPVTDPHAEPARPSAQAAAKLAMLWADHLVGALGPWRRHRRNGVLLVERGWPDMLVDPRRYRLSPTLAPWARLLGHALPRPDLTVLLSGDATLLHARKPEIGVAEVARQTGLWREEAPRAGHRHLEIDTTTTDPAEAATRILRGLRKQRFPWRRVPLTPSRVDLQFAGRGEGGLGLYHPFSPQARLGARVGPLLVRPLGRRTSGPPVDLSELCDSLGLRPDGAVSIASSTAGRHVVALCRDGRTESVLKVGGLGDDRLRHEAEMLTGAIRGDLPLRLPRVIWSGEWHDHIVLATETVHRADSSPWSVCDVVPLIEALASAGTDGQPLVHGDLAPWNLVRTRSGPVLLDWESSRWVDEPLHDLAHFVIQGGALLHRYTPEQAFRQLCAPGSPGQTLLARRGLDARDAQRHVGTYLMQADPTEDRAKRFHERLATLVSA